MKDEDIINIFFGTRQFIVKNFNSLLDKESKKFNKELYEYLKNKYDDSESIKETIYRIRYNIDKRPNCRNCGVQLNFAPGKKIFPDFCSKSCANSYNHKIADNTKLQKYGSVNNLDKMKSTCVEKYGVDNPWKSEKIKEKLKQTWIKKYGVDNYAKYSHNTYAFTEEAKQKRYQTMKKNGTFNSSQTEEDLYLYIKEKFPLVERQYKDKERYPYNCDFYIPELDLFLELQGSWTHGKHPYDPNSIEDQEKLSLWKIKLEEGHKYYFNAIKTWTIYDVKKREVAKQNNLNFYEIWSLNEGKTFIDDLSANYR